MVDTEIAALIPPQYATYRPLVSGGLAFFLDRLTPARIEEIVAAQLALPACATAADRLVALLAGCPTLHKLGQVVARDRRLPAALRARLQSLESLPASLTMARLGPLVRRETGRIAGLTIAPAALAEGSVAVVVPFAWRERPAEAPVRGVFKLLKPGAEARLREELEIWPALGGYLEARGAELGLPALDYRDTFESVRRLLEHEVRLDLEQDHLEAAARRYADDAGVCIPRLLPLSTPRMTAMERVDGLKVTAAAGAGARRRLAAILVDALVAAPLWSPAEAAPFHADPHAGNLLATADARVAILDWSLVATLGAAEREAMVRVVLAALAQDEAAACRAVAALGRTVPAEAALRVAVGAALREVRRGRLPGLGWALDLLDRVAASARMAFPESLVLFRKALLTLQGVIADVDPDSSLDRAMASATVARWAGGLAAPPFAAPFDPRRFAPELAHLWLGWPAAAARYWQGHWRDWLAPEGAP